MGGYGSGSRPRSRRRVAETCPRLTVRDITARRTLTVGHTAVVACYGEHRQSLPLDSTPQPFGGHRWRFRCQCGRLTSVLYFWDWWGCRQCHRLDYRSRRLSTPDRWQFRARKLYAKIGCTGQERWYPKPKGMRWTTFNRIVDAAQDYEEAAIGYGLRAFVAHIGLRAS